MMTKTKKTTGTHKVNKSAKSGKFVSAEYEKKHKATTFKQTVKNAKPKKK